MAIEQKSPNKRFSSPKKRWKNAQSSSDALYEAHEINLDSARVSGNHSYEIVRLQKERQWRAEYGDFVAAYNKIIANEGLPLVDYFLNVPTDEALETDRPQDTISDVDLGRKSKLRD